MSRLLEDASGECEGIEEIQTASGVLLSQSVAPCPFCGERAKFVILVNIKAMETDDGEMVDQSVVACNACDAHGPGGATVTAAVAAWNGRAGCK